MIGSLDDGSGSVGSDPAESGLVLVNGVGGADTVTLIVVGGAVTVIGAGVTLTVDCVSVAVTVGGVAVTVLGETVTVVVEFIGAAVGAAHPLMAAKATVASMAAPATVGVLFRSRRIRGHGSVGPPEPDFGRRTIT
jgi:hypothetical protein